MGDHLGKTRHMLRVELAINRGELDESESLLPVRPTVKSAEEASWVFFHVAVECADQETCDKCTPAVVECKKYRRGLAAHAAACRATTTLFPGYTCPLCAEAHKFETLIGCATLSNFREKARVGR